MHRPGLRRSTDARRTGPGRRCGHSLIGAGHRDRRSWSPGRPKGLPLGLQRRPSRSNDSNLTAPSAPRHSGRRAVGKTTLLNRLAARYRIATLAPLLQRTQTNSSQRLSSSS